MKKKLGVEIEFTGVTREEVTTALENLFQNVAEICDGKTSDDTYLYSSIKDYNGDTWLVTRDRSITPQAYAYKFGETRKEHRFSVINLDSDNHYHKIELVSPALTIKSLPLLFTVVDVIKSLGGLVNSSCGIHVHIDKPDDYRDIIDLYTKFCFEQENIFNQFGVNNWRLRKYCKPYNKDIKVPDCKNLDEFMQFLWCYYRDLKEHDISEVKSTRSLRYYALNFYSIFEHNTIEFRLFNSTLDRVKIAEILDWVLHFVYNYDEFNNYVSILGGILMNEIKEVK